jgi:hypothetical protein
MKHLIQYICFILVVSKKYMQDTNCVGKNIGHETSLISLLFNFLTLSLKMMTVCLIKMKLSFQLEYLSGICLESLLQQNGSVLNNRVFVSEQEIEWISKGNIPHRCQIILLKKQADSSARVCSTHDSLVRSVFDSPTPPALPATTVGSGPGCRRHPRPSSLGAISSLSSPRRLS